MTKRFSQMTREELQQEIMKMKQEARKIGAKQMYNEYEVLCRKITMAQSYLLDPNNFPINETYELIDVPNARFVLQYMNGIFGWGHLEGKEEEIGIPIALLKRIR
ncbi:YfhH family protein [Priestia taiwanensis]|uniref:Transcription regulator n=1 Tax=Priestia taiwanensis TaxID=1347902 RepID=A0A917AVE1_9BACI|nr:YfhH family protein [Priestia taiwanensis]MBM7364634.1 hypothetical protein [Priestia taiwanensis]GGE78395.1 hypothetical protein GCM10007140_30000 [Priestia taiwanensis]